MRAVFLFLIASVLKSGIVFFPEHFDYFFLIAFIFKTEIAFIFFAITPLLFLSTTSSVFIFVFFPVAKQK